MTFEPLFQISKNICSFEICLLNSICTNYLVQCFLPLGGLENVMQEGTNFHVKNMVLILTGCVQVTKWL